MVVDEENQTIEFTGGEGSGTVTLSDGSELTFKNVDKIEW